MARAYRRIGWLITELSHTNDVTYDRVKDVEFNLPWGTTSPLHLDRELDYLIRFDPEKECWEILVRSSG
ncbi:hypothetical protein SEA_YOSIF_32 [Streptomyces phage Yosif]|uniref:Uncharacterized protein n=1 Tax=Streptomyces phage Yosif TaxID=2201421 RepID=A0A2Z4QCF6_9CAUD|nr:hypothetical protein KGG71_gp32 [Streptomyces phage Yosif]AWY07596.1 hypothetical protein SEA_YOSIF_32 [Streptomyces phage Yosif]